MAGRMFGTLAEPVGFALADRPRGPQRMLPKGTAIAAYPEEGRPDLLYCMAKVDGLLLVGFTYRRQVTIKTGER